MLKFLRESYYARLWASIILLLGGGLAVLSLTQFLEMNNFWNATLSNVASALIITGVFSIINEYLLREKLVELILSKLKLRESIDKTGIIEVFSDINDIDYRFLIKNSKKKIDILHIYARTWTNHNYEELKEKVQRSNVDIRIILLCPESKLIDGLAEHYGVSKDDLVKRIKEVEQKWKELYYSKKQTGRKKTQSSIRLFYSDYLPTYSIYRFDDQLVNVQSKPSKEKTRKLPSLLVKDTLKESDLFDMYTKQFEDVIKHSKEVIFERD
ncbi:hypothetical protein ACFWGC_29550 [Cytobacillus pseudoceanisediminis]|uniref:hypothetical protein n=1 Tax=Bacillaceae TaxID=186817 RepID=UPI001A8C1A55|nr:hypothetical protein [Bacillus sp. NTK034]MBN8199178.1 hypothetical protein [Bacillus sp. NTK034]